MSEVQVRRHQDQTTSTQSSIQDSGNTPNRLDRKGRISNRTTIRKPRLEEATVETNLHELIKQEDTDASRKRDTGSKREEEEEGAFEQRRRCSMSSSATSEATTDSGYARAVSNRTAMLMKAQTMRDAESQKKLKRSESNSGPGRSRIRDDTSTNGDNKRGRDATRPKQHPLRLRNFAEGGRDNAASNAEEEESSGSLPIRKRPISRKEENGDPPNLKMEDTNCHIASRKRQIISDETSTVHSQGSQAMANGNNSSAPNGGGLTGSIASSRGRDSRTPAFRDDTETYESAATNLSVTSVVAPGERTTDGDSVRSESFCNVLPLGFSPRHTESASPSRSDGEGEGEGEGVGNVAAPESRSEPFHDENGIGDVSKGSSEKLSFGHAKIRPEPRATISVAKSLERQNLSPTANNSSPHSTAPHHQNAASSHISSSDSFKDDTDDVDDTTKHKFPYQYSMESLPWLDIPSRSQLICKAKEALRCLFIASNPALMQQRDILLARQQKLSEEKVLESGESEGDNNEISEQMEKASSTKPKSESSQKKQKGSPRYLKTGQISPRAEPKPASGQKLSNKVQIEKNAATEKELRCTPASTYLGVHWKTSAGRWRAKIKSKELGFYKDEKEAALAYDRAKLDMFQKGEIQHSKIAVNFPELVPPESLPAHITIVRATARDYSRLREPKQPADTAEEQNGSDEFAVCVTELTPNQVKLSSKEQREASTRKVERARQLAESRAKAEAEEILKLAEKPSTRSVRGQRKVGPSSPSIEGAVESLPENVSGEPSASLSGFVTEGFKSPTTRRPQEPSSTSSEIPGGRDVALTSAPSKQVLSTQRQTVSSANETPQTPVSGSEATMTTHTVNSNANLHGFVQSTPSGAPSSRSPVFDRNPEHLVDQGSGSTLHDRKEDVIEQANGFMGNSWLYPAAFQMQNDATQHMVMPQIWSHQATGLLWPQMMPQYFEMPPPPPPRTKPQ